MGEDELATELVLQLLRHGSEVELPFQPIVAAGPNGANPHATPSSRPLSPGDLLIIDWGASYGGYCSDLTRTFAVGDVGKEEARIHQVVLHANREGRKAGREGLKCGAVDEVVRRIIEEAGYGPFFTHRTGHGIGRQCHEEPYLRKGNEALLQCGMVYTVEPGVYLPSRNGVRIEDMVVVEERGPVTISSLPRDLIHVGQAGVARMLIILALANTVTVLTSISLAAIATNLRVKGGGDYYLISRTLGYKFGGSIGIVLFLAQSVSVAFYCMGFGEALSALLPGSIASQYLAMLAVGVLFIFAWLGADWATKFQYVVMLMLFLAL
ncbi:unnamed protein product, partial [Cyprideis torosa]